MERNNIIQSNWHAKTIIEALALTKSDKNGLSEIGAEKRLNQQGPNVVEVVKYASIVSRFLQQFHNILIYTLLISAGVTFFLGYMVDTWVILAVVLLNAIFGFIQEGKAEKAINAIRQILTPSARVMREGVFRIIPAKNLVVGDIVLVQSGDKVPADLRLISTKNLQAQESMLTGESNPVEKNTEAVTEDKSIGDRMCMVYSGTVITYGKGSGVVVATGSNTEIGKIGTILKNIRPLTTPLLCQMNTFSRWLTLAIAIFAVITFAVGVLIWKNPMEQAFMVVVGLVVAAIPEGLPPIITIILAIGVTRMAKRNAIIRQLPAVETMGAVTTICTDKTGTLTRNEQTIKSIITAKDAYNVEENGNVVFSIDKTVVKINDHNDLFRAINASLLCNEAAVSKDSHGKLYIHGNSIDKACLELGNKIKVDVHLLQQELPLTDLIPYESEHKLMATLHHSHDNFGFIYIKGAPEHILSRCSFERLDGKLRKINYQYWHEQINILAHQGYRIIAIAFKEVSAEKSLLLFEDITKDLALIAIFGLIDAPRPEVAQAVEQCNKAGIKVKMITGDHAITAAAIASQIGIDSKEGILTGSDLDKMDDDELAKKINNINIYARTSAHHKLRLVQALQDNGELVAMTGDGINDAPALHKANIGIAMGHRGAEIAKDSSAMVLVDDNFATIVKAIKEGRVVYDNLKKAILLILPTNAAEAFTVALAIIFGFILPITPVQILWVNMVTSIILAVALGFEPAENNVMNRPPRHAKSSILSKFLVWRIIFVSILLVSCVFGLFAWQSLSGVSLATARTMAVNMLVMGEAIYLLNCRKIYYPVWEANIILSSKPALIVIGTTLLFQVIFTYLPIMQNFFDTTAISVLQWLYILIIMLGIFFLVELEKLVLRRFILKVI